MQLVGTCLKEASHALFAITRDRAQAWLEAELLLGKTLSKNRVWILTHQDHPLEKRALAVFQRLLKRRLAHEPLAYLFGEAPFCGHLFLVNRDALIPRIETEQLAKEAEQLLSKAPPEALILDVGTGSGILAITLHLLFPKNTVIGTDVSAGALRVAKKNAKQLCKKSPLFLEANLLDDRLISVLQKKKPSELFVVANLPYLPPSQKRELSAQVIKYEPLSALFAEKQGRALNEKLIQQLGAFQKKTGIKITALLEFDPSQKESLLSFAKKFFSNTKILFDLHQRARFLKLSS